MTYRHDPNPVFWATVKAKRPGEGETDTFRAKFKALTADEFNGYDLASPDGTRDFLEAVLQDVDQVEAADGSPLQFTIALRDSLIRTAHIRGALCQAYIDAFRAALSGN